MSIDELINKSLIWKDIDGNWCRTCPKCNKVVKSKTGKIYVMASFIKNRACHLCKRIGTHHSKETIEKIILPQKNRPLTKKHRKKLSIAARKNKNHPWRNCKRPNSFGESISKKLKGRFISSEWKQKFRIAKLKRFEKLGISACEDQNSKEFFCELNKQGYNFNPKVFMEIGYVADGYDKEKNVWIEYDTPYHNISNQKEKDLIRQKNIIKYFESNQNPLKSFMRIKVDKDGNILDYNCVYGNSININIKTAVMYEI